MVSPDAPAARRKLSTGVYPVSRNRGVVLPEQLACAVQDLLDHRTAAALVLPTCATPARSALAIHAQLDLTMTAPLLEWLGAVRQPVVLEVPLPFRRALRSFRALVLPVATPVLHLGSLVIPDPAHPQATARLVDRLTGDFALRLDASQRRDILAHLAGDEAQQAPESKPVPRVSTIPPVSSRRSA